MVNNGMGALIRGVIDNEMKKVVKNITVTLSCDDGVLVTGVSVIITDTDSGVVYATKVYDGQPLTFEVPNTFNYKVHWNNSYTPQGGQTYTASTNDVTGTAITDVSIVGIYLDYLSQMSTAADVKNLLDNGGAESVAAALSNGRKLSIDSTWLDVDSSTEYLIPWNIVNVQTVYDSSDGEHTGVVIEMDYAFFQPLQFDAAENLTVTGDGSLTYQQDLYYYNMNKILLVEGTDYQVGDIIPTGTKLYYNEIKDTTGNIISGGYDNYKQSGIRQWLNGIGGKGAWWTAQHVGDTAPSQLDSMGGFKGGFVNDSTFYPYIKEVRVRTALNKITGGGLYEDCYDTFFLPSATEMYGAANENEGPYWEYWKKATGLSLPNNKSNVGRIIYYMNNTMSASRCWLRSPLDTFTSNPWYIALDGEINTHHGFYANAMMGINPACVIY